MASFSWKYYGSLCVVVVAAVFLFNITTESTMSIAASTSSVALLRSRPVKESQGDNSSDSPSCESFSRWSYNCSLKGHENELCVPMGKWQVSSFVNGNSIHEIDMLRGIVEMGAAGLSLEIAGNGGSLIAWKVQEGANEFLLKTFLIKKSKDFDQEYAEKQRVDRMVMERRSSSPHIIDIYAACGFSQLNEFADGGRFCHAITPSLSPKKRLQYAIELAQGLADLHGEDESLIHADMGCSNYMVSNGKVKLTDFNHGLFLRWNTVQNSLCGVPTEDDFSTPGRHHRQIENRAPEELVYGTPLTTKIDVYGLGTVLYTLLTGVHAYTCEPLGDCRKNKFMEDEELLKLKFAGIPPTLPPEISNSSIFEIEVIRDGMYRALEPDWNKRPSAQDIADFYKHKYLEGS